MKRATTHLLVCSLTLNRQKVIRWLEHSWHDHKCWSWSWNVSERDNIVWRSSLPATSREHRGWWATCLYVPQASLFLEDMLFADNQHSHSHRQWGRFSSSHSSSEAQSWYVFEFSTSWCVLCFQLLNLNDMFIADPYRMSFGSWLFNIDSLAGRNYR